MHNRIASLCVLVDVLKGPLNRSQRTRAASISLRPAAGRMGDYVRRFKGRPGKAEGIVAAVHKLARIIWSMFVSGRPYDEDKAFKLTAASTAQRLKNRQNQANQRMTLVPA